MNKNVVQYKNHWEVTDLACLKCGRETNDVFCAECQQVFSKYPVKSDTPIALPDREAYYAEKRSNQPKRKATAEEQNVQLRKLLKVLLVLWGITALTLAAFILLWILFL